MTKEALYSGAWATETGSVAYDVTPGYSDAGFDEVGNRRQRTVTGSFPGLASGTTAYSAYTLNDWLGPIQNGQVGATFDPNGNTTAIDLNGDGAADNTVSDVYDLENRLVEAQRPAGLVRLVYDGDGNRVQKTVGSAVTNKGVNP